MFDKLRDDQRAHLQRPPTVRLLLRQNRQPLRLRTAPGLIEGRDIGHPRSGDNGLSVVVAVMSQRFGARTRYVRGGGVSPWLNTGSR
jgi:hypothetical protein